MKRKQNTRLIKPSLTLQSEFMDMVRDFISAGEGRDHQEFQFALEDFPIYVRNCRKWEKGVNLPAGWVPSTSFWLIRSDNLILGVSSLRHKLNKALRIFGGNIGYKIRPGLRQKGYGTTILKLTLNKAKLLGLNRGLITCDDDNAASARVIETNGGILKDKTDRHKPGKLTRRYWIKLK